MSDPTGQDFLRTEEVPEISPEDKVIIENGFKNLSGAAPSTEEEKRTRYVNQVYFCMDALARWSGNTIENVAMCVDSAFVKNFKYTDTDYKARPYVFHGTNLQTLFLRFCQEGYTRYIQKDQMAYDAAGGENYLPAVDWDTVKNLATVGMRFHLQYWDAHPTLSRAEAFKNGKELLLKECSTKMKPKQVMKAYLLSLRIQDATNDLLALETEIHSGAKLVFTDSSEEVSNAVISDYLRAVDFKWKQAEHPFGALTALQKFMRTLDEGSELQVALKQFSLVQFKDTSEHRELKKAYEAKMELKKKKADEAAKRLATKTQKESEKTKIALQKQELILNSKSEPKKKKSRRAQLPSQKVVEAKEVKQFASVDLHRQALLSCTLRVPEKDGCPIEIGAWPIRHYEQLEGGVVVTCSPPGSVLSLAVKQRVNNVSLVLGKLEEANPSALEAVFMKANHLAGGSGRHSARKAQWIPTLGLYVVAAIFMDATGKIKCKTTESGKRVVATDVLAPALLTTVRQSNFSMEMAAIAPTFLNAVNVTTFPMYATAFSLLCSSEYAWGGGLTSEKLLELLETKVLPEKIPKAIGEQVIDLIAIVNFLIDKTEEYFEEDFTKMEEEMETFDVFRTKFEVPIPTSFNTKKRSRRGK